MRRFLLLSPLILLLCLGLFTSISLILAEGGLFHPGNPFFQIQYFVEQRRSDWTFDQNAKLGYQIKLVERRTADLASLAGSPAEADAIYYLNENFNQALNTFSMIPADKQAALFDRLDEMLRELETTLSSVSLAENKTSDVFLSLQEKVSAMRALLSMAMGAEGLAQASAIASFLPLLTNNSAKPDSSELAAIPDHAVLFPPGSAGALHAFYPLTGQHAELACESCHAGGRYAGTPATCESCHISVKPIPHFNGDCAACHTSNDWAEIHFDHTLAGTGDCQSCHNNDKPANHFQGQCSACHNTLDWAQATFNHIAARATDCQACHSQNKPTNHFAGQCSACHSTNAWRPANFNHSGLTDCQSCHAQDKPADHFSGQCSACHSTSAWRPANFNHSGQTDCQSCHAQDKPANHFSGQCSACHSTSAWRPASFDHSGQADCQSCHSDDRPADHFQGQCSNCHSTSSWGGANFNHDGFPDCQSCHNRPADHFQGQCSNCHSTSSWGGADFNHDGLTDCQSCHNRPADHFQGQCSNCHSTSTWGGADFNHDGLKDCQSCHNPPADHWSGQCSKCHNPNNWGNVNVDGHSFPMGHGDSNGQCSNCHNGTKPSVNCFKCHDQDKMVDKHREKGIEEIAGRCLDCHPNGGKD